MNRRLPHLLLALPLLVTGAEAQTEPQAQANHILLPLDTGIVPSAKVLLQELSIYLKTDQNDNYQRNKLGIHHHLSLLKEHYPKEAEIYLSQLSLWTHSEHFLERLPSYFLDLLVEQRWHIHPEALGAALNKLESLMPTDPLDMIDCAAGKPMGQILRLLAFQKAPILQEKLTAYEQSQDSDLAYAALCADLNQRNLPAPTYRELVQEHWNVDEREDIDKLSPLQSDICCLITVDSGINDGAFVDWVDVPVIKQAANYLLQLDMKDYAKVLQGFITHRKGKESIIHGHQFDQQCLRYSFLAPPRPASRVAQIMLVQDSKDKKHD